MGTVIEFNDGQDRKVLVLDAQYRDYRCRLYTQQEVDITTLPNLNNVDYAGHNTVYINGEVSPSVTLSPEVCKTYTDEYLNQTFVVDTNTSRYNTTEILNSGYAGSAVTWCRSQTVDGVGCDVPNIQTLYRIFCDALALDELDPTIGEYSHNRLANWMKDKSMNSGLVMSSTEGGSEYTGTALRANGYISSFFSKNDFTEVIPVLEL